MKLTLDQARILQEVMQELYKVDGSSKVLGDVTALDLASVVEEVLLEIGDSIGVIGFDRIARQIEALIVNARQTEPAYNYYLYESRELAEDWIEKTKLNPELGSVNPYGIIHLARQQWQGDFVYSIQAILDRAFHP